MRLTPDSPTRRGDLCRDSKATLFYIDNSAVGKDIYQLSPLGGEVHVQQPEACRSLIPGTEGRGYQFAGTGYPWCRCRPGQGNGKLAGVFVVYSLEGRLYAIFFQELAFDRTDVLDKDRVIGKYERRILQPVDIGSPDFDRELVPDLYRSRRGQCYRYARRLG
jgi:hypothetical protein